MRKFIAILLLLSSVSAGAAVIGETVKGDTDFSVDVSIIDSTDGTPETGVVFNTAGIDLWYRREGAAVVDITEATLASLATAHADGGFLHVDHGIYRLDLPDAAVASGADYVTVGGTVTGMIVFGGRVQLTSVDMNDAVRAGLTALPNAVADAAGGLPISDAGGLDLDGLNTNVNDIETDTAVIGAAGAGLTALATQASVNTVDSNVDAILVDTGTTLPGSIATIDANVDAILVDTGTTLNAALATVDSNVDAILVDTTAGGTGPWTTGGGGSSLALADNTAQGGTASTIQLAAAETFADDEPNSNAVCINGGTGAGQCRVITDYVSSTDTATVADNWATNPDNTSEYFIANGSVNTAAFNGAAVSTNVLDASGLRTALGLAAANLDTQLGNIPTDGDVNTQVDLAIETYHLDHLLAADYDPASKPGTGTALLNELIESDAGVSQFTANALEEAPTGSGASVSAIADAVWTEAIADHSGGAGSTAEALDDASAGGGGGGLDAAGVRAALGMASANLDTQLGTIDGNVDDIETDTGTTLPATLTTIGNNVSAALADTNELQTDDVPGLIAALPTDADVNVQADLALSDYDPPTRAELTSDINGLNDISIVDIRNMVIDDQGAVTLGCAMAAQTARLAGDWSGTTSVIYQDATGTETRVTVDLGTADQRDSTITCPTY